MGHEPMDPHVSLASPLAAVTITCGLGDRRQMQMAINISGADPLDLQNEMLDRAMVLLDRQQARYDLSKLESEFEEAARHLRNFLNSIPIAEQTAKHQLAVLKTQLAAQREAREEVYKQGYDVHMKTRKGVYEPSGALKGRLNGMDIDIRKSEEAISAVPNDLEQGRQKALETVNRYQEDLKKRRVAINDLRHVAGMPEHTAFAGIEFEAPGVEG